MLEWITPQSAGSISNQTLAIERQDESGDCQYQLRVVKKNPDDSYRLHATNPDYEDMTATDEMKPFARFMAVIK
ncbi:hypothetical protein [Zobellella maritima]|uniref:hypothetical protein n=1 Tax=Zobellella maritima TaxID=2059725 RepID=UPI001E659D7D|nr:hypothetical protein [Zobellella maritima]